MKLENKVAIVCACDADADSVIVVTAYQPDPSRWIDYTTRRKS